MTNDPFLRLKSLSKSYIEAGKTHQVLKDVTADFKRGEFVAVLGKSGCGKTTLLNLISGIDRADSGDIEVDGLSLTGMNDKQRTLFRRKNTGFIFQFFNLIPTLTVWENVILPLELNNLLNEEGRQRAEELLEEVGLAGRFNAYPDRLSGGEQQRVAIARAIIHNPLLVFADEPTGNLDETTGKQVMELLDRLTRQADKNLLLVTHSLEAASYADRILVMHNGQLESKSS